MIQKSIIITAVIFFLLIPAKADIFIGQDFNYAVRQLKEAENIINKLDFDEQNIQISSSNNDNTEKYINNPFVYLLKGIELYKSKDPVSKKFLFKAYTKSKDDLGKMWFLRDRSLKSGIRQFEDNYGNKIDLNQAVLEALHIAGGSENLALSGVSGENALEYYKNREYRNALYEAELAVKLAPKDNRALNVQIKINDSKLKASGNSGIVGRITIVVENMLLRLKMFKNLITDFTGQAYIYSNISLFIYFVIMYSLVYMLFFAVFKYLQVIYHQIYELISKIYSNESVLIGAIIIVLAAPLFLGVGWLYSFLVYIAISFIYFKRWEKVLLAVFIILLFAGPFIMHRINLMMQPFIPDNYVSLVYRSQKSAYSESLMNNLNSIEGTEKINGEESHKNVRNFYTNFSKALLYKRNGDFNIAVNTYKVAAQDMNNAKIYNNLGNIYAVWEKIGNKEQRMSEAEKMYNKALELDPQLVEALYNISTLYALKHQFDLNKEYEDRASALDFEKVRNFSDIVNADYFNRMYMDAELSNSDMWNYLFDENLYHVRNILPGFVLGIDYKNLDIIPVVILIMIVFLSYIFLRKTVPEVHTCRLCYKPMTKEREKEYMDHIICSECYHILKDLKTPNLIQSVISNIKKSGKNLFMKFRTLISVFFPGAVQAYFGDFAQALVYSIIYIIFIFYFLLSFNIIHLAQRFPSVLDVSDNTSRVLMLILFAVFWFIQYRAQRKFIEKLKKDSFKKPEVIE